ncbi:hypothetical protein [Paenibacillus xylaniclasticus]|uniref:hypothetical protein n=1 Tax=Paenibacillus xylaniclasticus TaxID=588083 RepID=UPI00175EAE6D|nr:MULTISPECIES: hypothetical protein [Paenibacillus]GFN30960.1 hypothetical protein PCURB6_12200 [Paenibacillus curdlanolyticus]
MSDKLTIINDKFQREDNGTEVDGLTIIIDGTLKQVFDKIIAEKEGYDNYSEVLRDALFQGINSIIKGQ